MDKSQVLKEVNQKGYLLRVQEEIYSKPIENLSKEIDRLNKNLEVLKGNVRSLKRNFHKEVEKSFMEYATKTAKLKVDTRYLVDHKPYVLTGVAYRSHTDDNENYSDIIPYYRLHPVDGKGAIIYKDSKDFTELKLLECLENGTIEQVDKSYKDIPNKVTIDSIERTSDTTFIVMSGKKTKRMYLITFRGSNDFNIPEDWEKRNFHIAKAKWGNSYLFKYKGSIYSKWYRTSSSFESIIEIRREDDLVEQLL